MTPFPAARPGASPGPPSGSPQADPTVGAAGLAVQQGTLPRAALVGAAILGIVGVIAWFGFSGRIEAPMDRYLRQGPEAAAAALKQDLSVEFPTGSPVAPLLQRLQALGMGCTLAAASWPGWECAITVRVESRRTLQLRASIGIIGDRVAAIETMAGERGH